MSKCKKCKGKGMRFIRLYDTAIGNMAAVRNKKGQLGKYTLCPDCMGTGKGGSDE